MTGSVVGVGVDLVDIDELGGLLAATNGAFLEAAWTDDELRDCAGRPTLLAATWALKEAVMKALGLGLGDVDPLDVTVDWTVRGRPDVVLLGDAAMVASERGIASFLTSALTTGRWAVATAFAVAGPDR